MHISIRFGSKTSGFSDEYSDNDLLVICADKARKSIVDNGIYADYNISFFSIKQLYWMKKKGSLFLQHIKRDGVVTCDRYGFFNSFFKSCHLIPPEDSELERCKSTLSFIASLPNEDSLIGWKVDFAYCVSRDFLIKSLAKKKILAFGLEEVISLSKKHFCLAGEELDRLKEFRKYKAMNRGGNITNVNLDDIRLDVDKLLEYLILNFDVDMYNNDNSLIDSLSKRIYSSTYEALRCLEALYIIAENKGINHVEHHKIVKYIKCPNLYRSLHNSKGKIIKDYIFEISDFLSGN